MVVAVLDIKSFPDFCGVAGLLVSVVGLIGTWLEARKARTAAEHAAAASQRMREDLDKFDIVRSLSETVAAFEEAKTLQRYGVWELLPASYSEIRMSLMTIKNIGPNLTNTHRRRIQSAVQTCSSIEDEIEIALSQNVTPQDVPLMNKTISAHILDLQELLLHVRNQVGQD
ncbi:MAG: hypothetical protein DME97_11080 [Verrucomicrobia bacterium]|nr:MAG: hypothetical protein DME97_11080 [Verrucomicrobiota bacterium]